MELTKEEKSWYEAINTYMLLVKTDIILDNKDNYVSDLKKLNDAINEFIDNYQQ